ncbi:hypothetical protein [Brachybacterium sp. J153]|uniref:hypothetical protein n=1 Tax=Brachybacterium sp. J153 TaxID=3116488 RepID=UPI002E76DC40|nr:hypothetical protein [Brachybacterium sp. J153]MEE1618451.1 hypothetical protein [Brachybacterium sp. J153]
MATTTRRSANRAFVARFLTGVLLYALGLAFSPLGVTIGLPLWLPALVLSVPGIALMAIANIAMYRSGDEFERRKIAEAVLFAFVIATPLILIVGALQFFGLPQINWIFAFSILMIGWLIGTVLSTVRYR